MNERDFTNSSQSRVSKISSLTNSESRSFIDYIIRVKIFLCIRWEVHLRRYSDAFQRGHDLLKPDPRFLLKSILRKSQSSPTQSQVCARLGLEVFFYITCTRVPPARRIICSSYPQGLCVCSLSDSEAVAMHEFDAARRSSRSPRKVNKKFIRIKCARDHMRWTCCTSREKGGKKEKRKKKQTMIVDGPFVINRNVYRSSPSPCCWTDVKYEVCCCYAPYIRNVSLCTGHVLRTRRMRSSKSSRPSLGIDLKRFAAAAVAKAVAATAAAAAGSTG
ncbi:unnamed protein product [Trichogramma brassicae]|uniref:Uncharacterized protein n=1 Tax=Trichogramma brassicae TaxID=86971 RepID=A0A6H5IEC3_9HYME|nr:unnamed protein product [Trichogramma brassicae]